MLAVLVLSVLAPIIVLLVWNQRTQERIYTSHRDYLYGLIERLQADGAVREQRIRELEDALYAKHAAVLELPNINREPPTPELPPLPREVQAFIDGFTEPEVRDEFAEEARRIIAGNPALSAKRVVEMLAHGVNAG